jgi:hypothetical protein
MLVIGAKGYLAVMTLLVLWRGWSPSMCWEVADTIPACWPQSATVAGRSPPAELLVSPLLDSPYSNFQCRFSRRMIGHR